MMNYGGPMMGGFGGPGMMPGAPMVGFGQAFAQQSPFLGGIPGKIAGGIGDWWGQMGPMDRGQIIGGALTGLGNYLQDEKDNKFRDRQMDLVERRYGDERADKDERDRKMRIWLAQNGR